MQRGCGHGVASYRRGNHAAGMRSNGGDIDHRRIRGFGPAQMNDADMNLASGVAAFEAKEFRRAFQLLAPLAARGEADAQFRVAVMSRNGLGGVANEALAFSSMRDAAGQGHGLAQHGLGVMYLYGECVEKDEAEAARWFRRAADQGLAGAMMTLGMMYEQGLGVERDAEQARRLYMLAESAGSG